MDILDYLVHLVSEAKSPSETLRSATQAIAEDMGARSCRIFSRRDSGRLVLSESFADEPAGGAVAAAESLAAEAIASVSIAKADTPAGMLLAAPMVSRARRLGAIVVERAGRDRPFLDEELERFSAVASEMVDLIEGVNLVELIEGSADAEHTSSRPPKRSTGEQILVGTAASPGIAIGVATFRHAFPSESVRRNARQLGEVTERERLRDAFQKTQNDLVRMQSAAASELGEEHALIFGAHLLLLRDSMLLDRIEQGIHRGQPVVIAVDDAFQAIGARLRAVADPYIQERIEDVEDLRSRVLGHLLEIETAVSSPNHVVISPRTSPSIIMELKAQGAQGVASEHGGTTSHGVLLARALGVPAVTGVPDLMTQVVAGDALIIDGSQGRVIVRPSADTFAEYTSRAEAEERARTEFSKFRHAPAQTADRVRFKLQANVALGIDLDVARDNGSDGVGLYRTEFAFIAREGIPSRDEQVRIYAKAYAAFPEGPISFRILDLAGDKFLSSSGLNVASSAFHGYRSIRVLFDYPHILRDQAQAFALAANGRPLRILVPMVSSLEELQHVKQLVMSALEQAPVASTRTTPSFGAMIEVPAAVEIVSDLAAEVDFFSIGTNDLVQYALVVDREDARLSSPRNAFHPAILRMIQRVVRGAHDAGKEVGVCGEMAARPEVAIALLALGVDALSVTPRAIPELKQKLSTVNLRPLAAGLDHLLSTPMTAGIEQSLRQYLFDGTLSLP
jgi:phosphoenolpyruvate-protein phosphotransferase